MCGIVGIIHRHQSVEQNEIDLMTDAIKSRGPDERGTWIDGNMALGHRRLSIIDLEEGHQPMFSDGKEYGIVFNGEIYNYKELRKILEDKNHIFVTHSDTEVLLKAYMEWGELCLSKLRGMFAFAIIDYTKELFFLARDHMGIKPLVYYHTGDTFAFASEIRAFKEVNNTKFTLDLSAIDEYLWLRYIPAPKTAFLEVKKLKPAHFMRISFKGDIVETKAYWDLSFENEERTKTREEWLDELNFVLKESVRTHLVADVPFGAFLSGGIDSTLVVKYMSDILDMPVETFSIGFEEEDYSELEYARMASRKYRTTQHESIITPNALEILPALVSHYGEPFGDNSAVPTYYVSKLARKFVPMVLSGDGADEIFAGYCSYRNWMKYLAAGEKYPMWKKTLRPLFSKLFPEKYPPGLGYGDGLEHWLSFVTQAPLHTRMKMWKNEYRNAVTNSIETFEEFFEKTESFDRLQRVQYMDIKTYLTYAILTKVDIASMMHGLEVRTPFVDKAVYEFAATMPSNINFGIIEKFGMQGKKLNKKILMKDFSESFVYRDKMGFAMPIGEWFREGGDYHGELYDRLLSSNSKLLTYFNTDEIQKVIRTNQVGPVWLLLFLDEWLRQEGL